MGGGRDTPGPVLCRRPGQPVLIRCRQAVRLFRGKGGWKWNGGRGGSCLGGGGDADNLYCRVLNPLLNRATQNGPPWFCTHSHISTELRILIPPAADSPRYGNKCSCRKFAQQILPYSEETSSSLSAISGSCSCHFGGAGALGTSSFRAGLAGYFEPLELPADCKDTRIQHQKAAAGSFLVSKT